MKNLSLVAFAEKTDSLWPLRVKCTLELLLKRERPEEQPLILNFSFYGVCYLESITAQNIKWEAPETKNMF